MKDKKQRQKRFIEFTIWEDDHRYIHKQKPVPIDEGVDTLLEIWKKI